VVMLEPVTAALRRLNSYLLFSVPLIPLSELGKGRLGEEQYLSMSQCYRARKGRMKCRVLVLLQECKCLKWHVFIVIVKS